MNLRPLAAGVATTILLLSSSSHSQISPSVPSTHTNPGGYGLAPGAEFFNTPRPSAEDKKMLHGSGFSYTGKCASPYIDFRNKVNGFDADVVISTSGNAIGAIVRSGGLRNPKVAQNEGIFPEFTILDCSETLGSGRGGFGIGLGKDQGNGKYGIAAILIKKTGYGYKPASSKTSGNYYVKASLGAVIIEDPGFGFGPDTQLIVEPSNGSVIRPIISDGRIQEVIVEKPGEGFTDMPFIRVVTSSGYNARFMPYLRFEEVKNPDKSQIRDLILVQRNTLGADPQINCTGIDCRLRNLGY